jgi:hypothetical protein
MSLPRYIIRKPPRPYADPTLENEVQSDYEKNSDFFLSSQTTGPPRGNADHGPFSQIRYGITDCLPQNYDIAQGRVMRSELGIPVRGACWKILERVCELRVGEVDLQGFVALWWLSDL